MEKFLSNIIQSSFTSMVIVLFLISFALYTLRYLKNRAILLKGKDKMLHRLQILESKALGNRQFLLIVAYENEKFLLGIYPNGMQFLCKFSSENMNDVCEKKEDERKSFSEKV